VATIHLNASIFSAKPYMYTEIGINLNPNFTSKFNILKSFSHFSFGSGKGKKDTILVFLNLIFTGLCIIIYSYSTTNKMHLFLQIICTTGIYYDAQTYEY